jgi:hypothetical protein
MNDPTSSGGGEGKGPAGPQEEAGRILTSGQRRLAASSALFFVGALLFYFAWHKTLPQAAILALGLRLKDGLIASGMLLAALGMGGVIRVRWFESRSEIAIELALGLGALSVLWLTVGGIGALHPIVAWSTLLIVVMATRRHWMESVHGAARGWREARPAGAFEWLVAGLSLILVLIPLFEALAPPLKYDALLYHLSLPQTYAHTGGIGLTPDNPFWGYPHLGEMLYTWAILLSDSTTAAAFGWMVGLATLLSLTLWLARWSRKRAWFACAALLGGTSLAASLGWAYTDWFLALYGLGILITLLSWNSHEPIRGGLLIGALSGLALGVKWSAAGGIAGSLVGAAIVSGARHRQRVLLAAVVATALVALPWFLKNQLGAGQPLYPLFGEAEGMDTTRQTFFRGDPGGFPKVTLLLLPLSATFLGFEAAPGFGADIGPLLVGLVPGALLLSLDERKRLRPILVLLGVGWLTWGAMGAFTTVLAQSRLHMMLFPAWSVLAANGAEGLSRIRFGRIRVRRLLSALVLLLLSINALSAMARLSNRRTMEFTLGQMPSGQFLAENLGTTYLSQQDALRRFSARQVLMLWEPRDFYCQPTCRPDALLDRWWSIRRRGMTAEEILREWKSQGVKGVLFYRSGAEFMREHDRRYSSGDWEALYELLEGLPLVADYGDAYQLYELSP